MTSIGEDAFSGCTGLNSIYYAGDMTSWLGITGLDSIISIIPNGTTSIPSEAFAYQKGITSVTIPDSVTSIGNYAFKGCDSLTSVSIGDGVTSIGRDAFEGCTALTEIHYTGDMESWWSIDGLDNIISSGRTWYIDGNKAAGDIVIPDGTTSIPSYAFEDCTGLTSVKIPDSVKSIGRNAFEGCSSLTSITIPESVTSIGWNAFDGCSSLTSITIPESVTSIGQSAFEGCTSLTSVTIGNGVTSIGFGAFQRCTALTSVNYNGTKAQWSAISKDSYWKYNSAIKKVVCTDGTITL